MVLDSVGHMLDVLQVLCGERERERERERES
jgi:hypothetical protein